MDILEKRAGTGRCEHEVVKIANFAVDCRKRDSLYCLFWCFFSVLTTEI